MGGEEPRDEGRHAPEPEGDGDAHDDPTHRTDERTHDRPRLVQAPQHGPRSRKKLVPCVGEIDAARGAAHLRVTKQTARGRAETQVEPLDGPSRREEIARMLAGETVTAAARAAAESLQGTA